MQRSDNGGTSKNWGLSYVRRLAWAFGVGALGCGDDWFLQNRPAASSASWRIDGRSDFNKTYISFVKFPHSRTTCLFFSSWTWTFFPFLKTRPTGVTVKIENQFLKADEL